MSARTSARSSANRQQPSSPPREQSEPLPVGRRTRSQSVEVEAIANTKRTGKRNARQGSVESETSNTSTSSSRKGRSKKATRKAVVNPELSIVAEDREAEELEVEEEHDDEGFQPGSPGGISQISGTTAITSHSQVQLQELEPGEVVDNLPYLLLSSSKVLDILAPSEALHNQQIVESIVKDIQSPESTRAISLRRHEGKFKRERENYGKQFYIENHLILTSLFGSPEDVASEFSPDNILHAANLARMISKLLSTQKQSTDMIYFLEELIKHFPFDKNTPLRNRDLLERSFSLGLELRTQTTIIALAKYKDELPETPDDKYDPEQILASYFSGGPEQPDAYVHDQYENGRAKDITRRRPNSDSQNKEIKKRARRIREAFRDSPESYDASDLVDFEGLDEEFPWSQFVTDFVVWTRLRLNEITDSIRKQGGIENIVKSIDNVRSNSRRVDLEYNPPAMSTVPRGLRPAAEIHRGSSGTSFYEGKKTIVVLEKLKHVISPAAASLSQIHQHGSSKAVASSSKAGPTRDRGAEASEAAPDQRYDDFNPGIDDDEADVHARPPPSTAEYAEAWEAHSNDKNKENRPVSGKENVPAAKKRSIMDAHPDAIKVPWESQDESNSQNIARPSTKRKHSTLFVESDESEDEGFESDRRNPGLERRINKQAAPQRDSGSARRASPKRARVESEDDEADELERRNRERAESLLQQSARGASADLDEDDDESEAPNPTQVRIAAMAMTQQAKLSSLQPQRRVPWSDRDSQHLVDCIESHGCSWSYIEKVAEFERGDVGQGALKDRARNMKINLLKAGVPLPINFDKVRLGKKEIESVRTVYPDYAA